MLIIPNSNGEDDRPAREVNHCHGKGRGHPCDGSRPDPKKPTTGPRSVAGGLVGAYQRPAVIRVRSIEEAVALILQGKVVELADTKEVHTVLRKLADIALDAVHKGEKAPNYDLCQVSVPGTSLFCAASLKTKDNPKGIPRLQMPQLGGEPVPGSPADKLPRTRNPKEVDGSGEFVKYVQSLGIKVTESMVAASKLRASQGELVGSKVALMMVDETFNPTSIPLFISRDNYVVDGHHRWAAAVGRDAADGHLGDIRVRSFRVDAPISEVLKLANEWSAKFGIKQAAGLSGRRAVS